MSVAEKRRQIGAEGETLDVETIRMWRRQRKRLLDEARGMLDRAEAEKRDLTSSEQDRWDEIMAQVEDLAAKIANGERRLGLPSEGSGLRSPVTVVRPGEEPFDLERGIPGRFAESILAAGFDLRNKPSVEVALRSVWPDSDVWNSRAPETVLPLSLDTRHLYPHLPSVDAQDYTAIEDFRQTRREVTGEIERGITATTEKARLDTEIEHVQESLRQLALVMEGIPNAVLERGIFADFAESELRKQIEQALDNHVLAQIDAADVLELSIPAETHPVEKVRRAVALMRAQGANPRLLVLNPDDAVTYDLLKQPGTNDYMFAGRGATPGAASPLWGLQIVEHRVPGRPPMLIDPQLLGVLYRGTLRLAADPYTGFTRNTTNLRVEMTALMHIRASWGACKIVDEE